MNKADVSKKGLRALQKAGLEKSESRFIFSRKHEFNIDGGEISLLRTTEDVSLSMAGITGNREGSVTLNKIDDASITEAAATVMESAMASQPDPANDISPAQPPAKFARGPEEPDMDGMYRRITEFLEYAGKTYPTLILEQVLLDFNSVEQHYVNSNGVDLESRLGWYSFTPMFTSKDGKDTSSFNYSSVVMADLDKALHELGLIDARMKESTEQVRSREFEGKFTGDLLITPDCFDEFIRMVVGYLSDYPLIKGTSIFKDSLGKQIASPGFTLSSRPRWEGLASGYFITEDGFVAEDFTIIRNGILKGFMLSLYGANKTGGERAPNSGGAYVMEPGNESLDDLVSGIDRGILLCRFSGGYPSDSGDFSGVAKNSYYVENGEIMYPVKEVMIGGNIAELLTGISGISRERADFGYSIIPWIRVEGISVSGK